MLFVRSLFSKGSKTELGGLLGSWGLVVASGTTRDCPFVLLKKGGDQEN